MIRPIKRSLEMRPAPTSQWLLNLMICILNAEHVSHLEGGLTLAHFLPVETAGRERVAQVSRRHFSRPSDDDFIESCNPTIGLVQTVPQHLTLDGSKVPSK